MRNLVRRGLLAMSLPLALVVGATAAEKATSPTKPECTEMMQQSSPEARRAMRELMHSERSPQAMSNMMEMARRMGDGDVMVGMTRMMKMMGSMGGGPMGQGGMMQPGAK